MVRTQEPSYHLLLAFFSSLVRIEPSFRCCPWAFIFNITIGTARPRDKQCKKLQAPGPGVY